MTARSKSSLRMRTTVSALIAVAVLAASLLALPAAAIALPGMPPAGALPMLVLPAPVLALFWLAVRQNRDDERARDDG